MGKFKGISLFSGAGGMDVGFEKAGVEVVLANELDPNACDTYEANHPTNKLLRGDIKEYYSVFAEQEDIDIVFGGPPCQGFSVAGKMDPGDERSKLIWRFLDVVEMVKPRIFIMENVKALGKLEKWKDIRIAFIERTQSLGYFVETIIGQMLSNRVADIITERMIRLCDGNITIEAAYNLTHAYNNGQM
jgi:DNA (cytosine-5)-methyltransferase 1